MSTNPSTQTGRQSPWRGTEHVVLHSWELDGVGSLLDAAARIRALAAELDAAHEAGWRLESPMLGGHLHAQRASRRQRANMRATASAVTGAGTARTLRTRVRVVDEASTSGPHLSFQDAQATPWLVAQDGVVDQVAGPRLADDRMQVVTDQVTAQVLGDRRWAVVTAQVGPGIDVVVEGCALRAHTVINGLVVRTVEVLGFKHAADRSATLPDAAAAYRRLADAAVAMDRIGGRLGGVDDGFLSVEYIHDAH